MEIVLIATLVALCWAVRRSSAETDRLRKPYAARHLLGPLPEVDRIHRGDVINRTQRKAGNPSWVVPAASVVTDELSIDDLLDDDWFPPFDNWIHSGRLPYVDYSDPRDLDPSDPLSLLYNDSNAEPFDANFSEDEAGHCALN